MALEAILDEVDQLHNVSTRLEGLAEQHAPITEALMTIAGSVRNTATMLAVPSIDFVEGVETPTPAFSGLVYVVV